MSGSNSSAPGSAAPLPEGAAAAPLSFTVHSMPAPALDGGTAARRTRSGRLKALFVLLVCAAPVVASYLAYFVIRPEGRSNYGTLIQPTREIPAALPLADLQGLPVDASSLKGQWLLVVVAGGACDKDCERLLWLQRQLRETLGREKERVDKVWLVDDEAAPRAQTLAAIAGTTVLRVPRDALAQWLAPAEGHALERHLYIVDPLGQWMMRMPADPEPARVKRDMDRLLNASAGWDRPGR
jgi:hypothetical protein